MQNGYTSRVNTRHGINVRTAYWNDNILSPEQVKINVQFLVNIRHQNIRTFSNCGRHKQLQENIHRETQIGSTFAHHVEMSPYCRFHCSSFSRLSAGTLWRMRFKESLKSENVISRS